MTDEVLRVGVIGARGRMGSEVCLAVDAADDLDLVAAVGLGDWLFSLADAGSQVAVDFTHPDAVMEHVRFCVDQNIHAVVGTSGLTEERLNTIREWLAVKPDLGVIVVPNFAIGAVLTTRFARLAARFFESAEIIEMHHAGKADAPSGTAYSSAQAIAQTRKELGPRAGPGRHHPAGGRRPRGRHRRDPRALGAAARAGRAPGDHPGQRRGDPDDPARLVAPLVVHARCAGGDPRRAGPARTDRRPGRAARALGLTPACGSG